MQEKSKSVWFKQVYVNDVLSGAKQDTWRRPTEKIEVGMLLRFSVGPRKPFALARAIEVNDILSENVEPAKLEVLIQLYGELPSYRQIVFKVFEVCS